jgi:hypothetical protein
VRLKRQFPAKMQAALTINGTLYEGLRGRFLKSADIVLNVKA